jgi:hypothetical protein
MDCFGSRDGRRRIVRIYRPRGSCVYTYGVGGDVDIWVESVVVDGEIQSVMGRLSPGEKTTTGAAASEHDRLWGPVLASLPLEMAYETHPVVFAQGNPLVDSS